MRVSIFTPSHNTKYLLEAYDSIKEQDFDEWIIGLNGDAKKIDLLDCDNRIRQINLGKWDDPYVGQLKALCVNYTTGDILVELDHDDLLLPTAISEIKKAFEDPNVGFVYSNNYRTDMNGNHLDKFSSEYGWEYRGNECVAFDPTPASVSKIWYAPDHVRAFRRDVYYKAGGYDVTMRVLDDQDLMARLYKITKFYHIDKPLYIYRIDGNNTYLKYNQEIQNNVYRIYNNHIEDIIDSWCDQNNLLKVELGGRMNAREGYTTVDLFDADINSNLNDKWPFEDNSVGVIRAFDVFEHLNNSIHTMEELYRILVPGGYAIIQVPSTDGRGAFQDPTHVTFWNENSFKYYTDKKFNKYIDCNVRFQIINLYTTELNNDKVCWTVAHLMKIPTQARIPGEISI